MRIRVMTFNIHHGRGIDGKLCLERIATVIERSEADIIGLNEIDRSFSRRSKYIDQLAWLAERLQMYHAFGPTISLKANKRTTIREYGNGLLSRYPIVKQVNHPFTPIPEVKEGRALLEVDILLDRELLKVYITHLSLQSLMRQKEIDVILHRIKNISTPLLLLGDCNMKPASDEWVSLASSLSDVVQMSTSGSLPTFPSFHPIKQLDYIFSNSYFQVEGVEVIRHLPRASDHLPLQATLLLVQSER